MATKSEFFTSLDNCSTQDEWEHIYAAATVKLTHDEACKIAASDKPYARWFGFRFDAGPPGKPLPFFDKAIERMSKGVNSGGSALDAFQSIYNGQQLPNDFPPETTLKILHSCAFFALTNGPTNFATWLAARAGLASIALGSPKLAWKLLSIPAANGQRHPNLQPLAFFEALRGHPHLENNRLIQIMIMLQWPLLDVPLLPHLPTSSQYLGSNLDELPLQNTLDALAEIGAVHIAQLTLDTFTDWHNRPQTILDIQNQEQKAVRSDVEKFRQEIHQIAHSLGDPHYLTPEMIQRAVTDIKKPALSSTFLTLAGICDGNSLEFLLRALSIQHFVSGTKYEDTWKPAALEMAADSIYEIGNPLLFPLRLELFNELIENPSPYQSLHDLYLQRAHTRAQIANLSADTIELTFNDYRQVIKLARDSKEAEWLAAGIAGFCSYLSVLILSRKADETYLGKEASDLLSEASTLDLSPFRSAQILLSRALISEPENAIKLLTKACDLLEYEDPYRLSVGTVLTAHILDAGDTNSAIKTAQTLLDDAYHIEECSELGEFKLIYGRALVQARQFKHAERELKSALLSLRGKPSSTDTNVRLLLIDLLCRRNAWDEADEQLLQLQRPSTQFNEEQRTELIRLKILLKRRPTTAKAPPIS